MPLKLSLFKKNLFWDKKVEKETLGTFIFQRATFCFNCNFENFEKGTWKCLLWYWKSIKGIGNGLWIFTKQNELQAKKSALFNILLASQWRGFCLVMHHNVTVMCPTVKRPFPPWEKKATTKKWHNDIIDPKVYRTHCITPPPFLKKGRERRKQEASAAAASQKSTAAAFCRPKYSFFSRKKRTKS